MMHIGVAASRHGLTDAQQAVAGQTLMGFWLSAPLGLGLTREITLHHGDCVNGDEWLADLAASIGYLTEAHPGDYARLRAEHPSTVRHLPQRFWVRNGNIISASDKLVGFPNVPVDPGTGSGTWQVIRRATGTIPVFVVPPDGRWYQQ